MNPKKYFLLFKLIFGTIVSNLAFKFVSQEDSALSSAKEICMADTKLLSSLRNSSRGSILNLTLTDSSLNLLNCEEIPVNRDWSGGKLILSDSPEYSSGRGKVYQDTTLLANSNDDPNRIFMYHCNGKSEGDLRFIVLIQNSSPTENATLRILKKGVAGPTTQYLNAGKIAFQRWMEYNSTSSEEVVIAPKGIVQLDPNYVNNLTPPDYILHGIWDYTMTQSHSVILCSLEPEDINNPIEACQEANVFSRDRHIRGTFPYADKTIITFQETQNSLERIIQRFRLADGTQDEFAQGLDATDGSRQINSGNYGILYNLRLEVKNRTSNVNESGFEYGYLINPRGGDWGGAVGVTEENNNNVEQRDLFLLPDGAISVGSNAEGAFIGSFNSKNNISMLWMPVGGSNLPVMFGRITHRIEALEN